jgi:hypothetical protein
MSLSNNFPDERPDLILSFANSGVLDPRITYTRASSATYFDYAGVLRTAASGVARFDHNPSTLAPLGFLIEEARTNSIRNNTMQGAVAGTPGTAPTNWTAPPAVTGLTWTIAGTGTDSGITYIDIRVAGTAGATADVFVASPESTTGVAASNGQAWTNSMFVKIQAGSTANIDGIRLRLSERDSGGANLTDGRLVITPTGNSLISQRYAYTRANTNASTAYLLPSLLFNVTNGAVVDITLRIGLPQLELGAFATSPILTSGAAATRLADSASITGTNFSSWYNQTEGTVVVQGRLVGGANSVFPRLVAFAGSNTNTDDSGIVWNAGTGSGALRGTITASGSTTMDQAVGASKSAGSSFKAALAYKANDSNAAVDGTAGTTDTSVTLPTVTQLLLGGPARFQPQANEHIQTLTYYRRRLPNQTLQTLTA